MKIAHKSASMFMLCLAVLLNACSGGGRKKDLNLEGPSRIVSLNGTLTEIVAELGFQQQLVGVDITSIYPSGVNSLPKLGYQHGIKAEGVLSLSPDLILYRNEEVSPQVLKQFELAGVRTVNITQTFDLEGTASTIKQVAEALEVKEKGVKLVEKVKGQMQDITSLDHRPKVLFIYARGAGSLSVAGENTPMNSMIQLCGGTNAVSGFEGYKPLTTEFLVAANPDVILMFDQGLSSVGGIDAMLEIPGLAETTAGKSRAFVEMDGLLLSGFGPRLPKAAKKLNQEFIKYKPDH